MTPLEIWAKDVGGLEDYTLHATAKHLLKYVERLQTNAQTVRGFSDVRDQHFLDGVEYIVSMVQSYIEADTRNAIDNDKEPNETKET